MVEGQGCKVLTWPWLLAVSTAQHSAGEIPIDPTWPQTHLQGHQVGIVSTETARDPVAGRMGWGCGRVGSDVQEWDGHTGLGPGPPGNDSTELASVAGTGLRLPWPRAVTAP